jgi:hypothetical protein
MMKFATCDGERARFVPTSEIQGGGLIPGDYVARVESGEVVGLEVRADTGFSHICTHILCFGTCPITISY